PRLPSLAFASSFLAPPTPPLSTLSLHAALPISRDLLPHVLAALRAEPPPSLRPRRPTRRGPCGGRFRGPTRSWSRSWRSSRRTRSEEHTSELQSREKLVCRLLLEKRNQTKGTGA